MDVEVTAAIDGRFWVRGRAAGARALVSGHGGRAGRCAQSPVRLRLLSVVASHTGGQACVCELSAGIELSQPTISDHWKGAAPGVSTVECRGSWVYRPVIPEALQ